MLGCLFQTDADTGFCPLHRLRYDRVIGRGGQNPEQVRQRIWIPPEYFKGLSRRDLFEGIACDQKFERPDHASNIQSSHGLSQTRQVLYS